MKNETSVMTSDEMSKEQMASVLSLLLNCSDLKGQLMKMSIPALRKVYEGINQNAMAYNLSQQKMREAEKEKLILSRRLESFERDAKRAAARGK